jgi:hypothetical protein
MTGLLPALHEFKGDSIYCFTARIEGPSKQALESLAGIIPRLGPPAYLNLGNVRSFESGKAERAADIGYHVARTNEEFSILYDELVTGSPALVMIFNCMTETFKTL